MMSEKKDKWMCPVCNNLAPFESLMLDGFFSELITSRRLPDDEHEIVLHNDASWDPLPPKIPDHLRLQSPPQPKKKKVETLNVDDDDGPTITNSQTGGNRSHRPASNRSVECVTLDSDSDENELQIDEDGDIHQTSKNTETVLITESQIEVEQRVGRATEGAGEEVELSLY